MTESQQQAPRQQLADGQIVDSEPFPYDQVEDPAGILCDELATVKLTIEQARAVLDWHQREIAAEAFFDQSKIVAETVAKLLASENPRMDAHCMAFAAGLDQAAGLGSQSSVARRLGVTRAAISKCTGKWKDILGYTITKFTRDEHNQKACHDAQITGHWRDRRRPWSAA